MTKNVITHWYKNGVKYYFGSAQSDVYLTAISDLNAKAGNTQITLTWTDPTDVTLSGVTLARFDHSVLVRKVWSAPTSESDWTIVTTTNTAGASVSYIDTGLTNWTTYYYKVFSTASNNNVTDSNTASTAPQEYRYMTLTIDESNSDPLASVVYSDDASTMTVWSTAWDEFFGYYPCLLDKNGSEYKIVKHDLSTNYVDRTKDKDNNDISAYVNWTSGEYNAMIAFPRLWLKMSKNWNTITVSLTDNPDAYSEGYHYLAHTDWAVDIWNIETQTDEQDASKRKDTMYMWAYKGSTRSMTINGTSQTCLCSNATGSAPTVSQSRPTFRTYARNYSNWYSQVWYYQLLFRQVLYLFKYKNLNSQSALWRWYCDKTSSWSAVACGLTNTKNMLCYGLTTSWTDTTNNRVVCFGIEDIWWNIWERIDGFNMNSYVAYTSTNRSNWADDTASNYYNIWTATSTNNAYITKTLWTTAGGFLPTANSWWNASTYYCDNYWTSSGRRVLIAGGYWYDADRVGVFYLASNNTSSNTYTYVGGRLMFL